MVDLERTSLYVEEMLLVSRQFWKPFRELWEKVEDSLQARMPLIVELVQNFLKVKKQRLAIN